MERHNFADLLRALDLHDEAGLHYLAAVSGISLVTVALMARGDGPVYQEDAQAVLRAISVYAQKPCTLDTVFVPLVKQSFAEIWQRHRLLLHSLDQDAGVSTDIILFMIQGIAVRRHDAINVLAALSRLIGLDYTLDNVDVNLQEEARP